jgi:hypothetical protein
MAAAAAARKTAKTRNARRRTISPNFLRKYRLVGRKTTCGRAL